MSDEKKMLSKAVEELLDRQPATQRLPIKEAAELARSMEKQYREMLSAMLEKKQQAQTGTINNLPLLPPVAPIPEIEDLYETQAIIFKKDGDGVLKPIGIPVPPQQAPGEQKPWLPVPPWERKGGPNKWADIPSKPVDPLRRYAAPGDINTNDASSRTSYAPGQTPQQPGIAGANARPVKKTPKNSNKAAWSSRALRTLQQDMSTYDSDVAQLFQGIANTLTQATGRPVTEAELDFSVNFGNPIQPNRRVLSVKVSLPVLCTLAITQRLGTNGQMIWDTEVFGLNGIERTPSDIERARLLLEMGQANLISRETLVAELKLAVEEQRKPFNKPVEPVKNTPQTKNKRQIIVGD